MVYPDMRPDSYSDCGAWRLHSGWSAILFVFVCGCFGAMQLGRPTALILPLAGSLNLSFQHTGLLISTLTLVPAVLGGAAMGLRYRLGDREILLLSLALMCIGAGIMALTSSANVAFVARLVEGSGYLLLIVAAPPLIVALAGTPTRQRRGMALWSLFLPVGLALASLGGGFVGYGDGEAWRDWFWLNVALGACLTVALVLLLPKRAPAARPLLPDAISHAQTDTATSSRRHRLRQLNAAGLWISLGFGTGALIGVGLIALLPTVLQVRHGLDIATAGEITFAISLLSTVGNLLVMVTGHWTLKWSTLIAGSIAITLCSALVFILTDAPILVAAAAYVAIACNGMVLAAVFALAPILGGDTNGSARITGWIAQFGSAGAVIGPALTTTIAADVGWAWAAPAYLATGLVMVVCFLFARQQDRALK
jgi:MFS family permease